MDIDWFQRCKLDIEALVASSETLDSVEQFLDDVRGISNEQKGALYIWGWHMLPDNVQETEARELLNQAARMYD